MNPVIHQRPEPDPRSVKERREAFTERTGHDPRGWVAGWKSNEFPGTDENLRTTLEALSIIAAEKAAQEEGTRRDRSAVERDR